MINETYYILEVKKITKETKEVNEYTRVYESDHPKMKEANPPEQYQYRKVIKNVTETERLLEQKLESIDIERVLKAINRNL